MNRKPEQHGSAFFAVDRPRSTLEDSIPLVLTEAARSGVVDDGHNGAVEAQADLASSHVLSGRVEAQDGSRSVVVLEAHMARDEVDGSPEDDGSRANHEAPNEVVDSGFVVVLQVISLVLIRFPVDYRRREDRDRSSLA